MSQTRNNHHQRINEPRNCETQAMNYTFAKLMFFSGALISGYKQNTAQAAALLGAAVLTHEAGERAYEQCHRFNNKKY